jgi:hypothetical protein
VKSSLFWNITPCILHSVSYLHLAGCLIASALKMESTCSSETSVDFQQTTRRYIPEDINLHI